MSNKSIVVNFFSGPGAGKSTLAAGLFYNLKKANYNVELLREFAKEKILEENNVAVEFQQYISANQTYTQDRAVANFDAVITDSPILLGIFYDKDTNELVKRKHEEFLIEKFKSYNNINYIIKRVHKYKYTGRIHNEKEAEAIDKRILDFFELHNIQYKIIEATDEGLEHITKELIFELSSDTTDLRNAKFNIGFDIERNLYYAKTTFKNKEFQSWHKDPNSAINDINIQIQTSQIRNELFAGPSPVEVLIKQVNERSKTPTGEIISRPLIPSLDKKNTELFDSVVEVLERNNKARVMDGKFIEMKPVKHTESGNSMHENHKPKVKDVVNEKIDDIYLPIGILRDGIRANYDDKIKLETRAEKIEKESKKRKAKKQITEDDINNVLGIGMEGILNLPVNILEKLEFENISDTIVKKNKKQKSII